MAPTILLQTLESVRRRVRWLTLVTGVGLVLTSVIAVLVIVAGLDYTMNLPAFPRTLLDVIAVAALGYSVWRWVIHPLLNRLTLNDVAGRVERAYPQFEDRLRSTVDIILGREVPGSEIMKQRVVSEATRLSNGLDLTRVVVAKPAVYSITSTAVAALLLAGIISLMDPTYTKAALSRMFTPFANVQWPKQVGIGVVGEIPTRVTVGQRIDVGIRLTKGDKPTRKAIIYYSYGDADGRHFGTAEQQLMTRGDDGVYHASIDARVPADALAGSLQIHIESGDAQTPPVTVRVVQRLSLTKVDAEVTAPAYAHVPVMKMALGQTPGVATIGSTVKVIAAFNKQLDPAKKIEVTLLGAKSTTQPAEGAPTTGPSTAISPITWAEPVGNTVTGTFVVTESLRFNIKATDIDGITNPAAEEFELLASPDKNPTVVIENPRHNEDCTPEAHVPFQAVAEDDFGIKTLTLIVDRLGDKKHWEIPLVVDSKPTDACKWLAVDAGGDVQRFRGNYDWTLAALKDSGLKPGDVLQYYAQVSDNYVLSGQVHPPVSSGWLRITIISQQQLDETITNTLNQIAENIQAVKQSQSTTATQTRTLAEDLKNKPKLDDADKVAVNRLGSQQSSEASEANALAKKTDELVARMEENRATNNDLKGTATGVRDLLKEAAEHPMKDAASDINSVPDAQTKEDRGQDLNDAASAQIKANEKLQKAIDAMGGIVGLNRALETAEALLAEQQKVTAQTVANDKGTIGKTRDQLTPDEKAAVDKNARDQADLGKRTDAAIAQMLKDMPKLAKSDPIGSKAMGDAAATGKAQDVPGKQADAAKSAGANEQSKTQNSQTQAELGLKAMVNDLKEAQARKLDELSRKLGELQDQVAGLIRQQAGHNLNDIALQSPADKAKIKQVTLDDLNKLAERDKNPLTSPVDLAMLAAAQEQTERNARDISKMAEDMPDGGEPADRLTRAADKMERAIVNLRASKVTEAYSPAMVDALESLQLAKKVIDEQKKKADENQEGQKKEAIKQKYIAILVKQNTIDQETTTIDGLPKKEDGSLARQNAVALTAVSKHQTENADTTKGLGTDLDAIHSTVYKFANDEIVKNMTEIRDALDRKESGPAVQAEQQEVVAMLQTMILDLETKPEKSPFAQQGNQNGGGGGQQKNKGLPTESELRLLKNLQLIVNATTTRLSQLPQKAGKADLVAAGNRQSSLRTLLGQLIANASGGKSVLGPEPKNEEQLPEEGVALSADKAAESVDKDEFGRDMLGNTDPAKVKPAEPPKDGKPPEPAAAEPDHALAILGDRMARSHQRLAANLDPGAVTQEIQKRIISDLDDLIEQARKKEAEGQNQPPKPGNPDDGQKMDGKKPKEQPQQIEAQKKAEQALAEAEAAKAAGKSAGGGGAAKTEGSNELAREAAKEWGTVSARVREAVTESKGEKVLDKYKALVDDYYRTMSTKANGQ